MKYIKRYFNVYDFDNFDLTTATGTTEFENDYLPRIKCSMIVRAIEEEKLNQDNTNYIFEFEREYWSEERIYNEIHKYPIADGKYLYRGNLYRKDLFEEMVSSKKPFDLVMKIKTYEDLKEEFKLDEMLENHYGVNTRGLSYKEKVEMYNKFRW